MEIQCFQCESFLDVSESIFCRECEIHWCESCMESGFERQEQKDRFRECLIQDPNDRLLDVCHLCWDKFSCLETLSGQIYLVRKE